MLLDDHNRTRRLVDEAIAEHDLFLRSSKIINGPAYSENWVLGVGMPYPHGVSSNAWSKDDLELFSSNQESVHEVAVANFARTVAFHGVTNGFNSAQLIQRRKESGKDLDH